VIVSAAFVAEGMAFLLSWPAMPALVFGVLIAATDPLTGECRQRLCAHHRRCQRDRASLEADVR
jgi:hypothetical protein